MSLCVSFKFICQFLHQKEGSFQFWTLEKSTIKKESSCKCTQLDGQCCESPYVGIWEGFDSYSNKRDAGMIPSSVLDSYLYRNAVLKGSYPKPITSFAKAWTTNSWQSLKQQFQHWSKIMVARQWLPVMSISQAHMLQSREQGTQVLWGCTECHCWQLIQPETVVLAQEVNVVVNGPVAAVAV